MAQHTPGPWAVKHERWIVATRGEHDGEIIVAPTYWRESSEAKAEAAANARLIAAAPDLLAALKWFVDDIKGSHTRMIDFDANVVRASAAIAKAAPPK